MIPSGITFKQGDIVIIPFPFTDLSAIKQRPVLIISNDDHNQLTEDIVVCGITSNLKDTNYSVGIDDESLLKEKIPVPSRIKVDKIFTLKQSLIKKKIGSLKPVIFNAVKSEIQKLIIM